MPDRDFELAVASVKVEWGPLRLSGPGRLRLAVDALTIEMAGSGPLLTRYAELLGGGWRSGAVSVHGKAGSVTFESPQGLDQAWASLIERTCPLPELARTHRLLGSRRGGAVAVQARFLAPLLQARRRLEEETDLDTRVTTMDAKALRERLESALQAIARERYPSSDPDRRALEAELEEAMAPLFGGLDVMDVAARHFRTAPETVRFMAWRKWVSSVGDVFALADSGWAGAARLLPGPGTT